MICKQKYIFLIIINILYLYSFHINYLIGWWRGQHGNKIGWFPSNYTQEELEDAHTYSMAENILDIMVRKLMSICISLL